MKRMADLVRSKLFLAGVWGVIGFFFYGLLFVSFLYVQEYRQLQRCADSWLFQEAAINKITSVVQEIDEVSDYVVFKEGGESFGSYRFIAYAETKSQGVVVYLDQSSSNVVKVSVPIKAVDFFIKKLKERKWYDGEVVFDVFTVWSVTTCGYIKVRENSRGCSKLCVT